MSYRDGTGVPQDDRKAAQLFQRAANKGHAGVQNALALCYLLGKGMPQDVDEAVRLCRRAAEQGHALGQFCLGQFYPRVGRVAGRSRGRSPLPPGSQLGNTEAMFNLANGYRLGRGVPQDVGEAARLYRLAAEQGSVHASI